MPADRARTERAYDRVAARMIRNSTLDEKRQHVAQSDQRMRLLSALGRIAVARPDLHTFSELLILYPDEPDNPARPRAVVPDVFCVVHAGPITADTNFAVPLQPAGPFLTMDFLSEEVPRKDYGENLRRYERDLRVPYALRFDTDRRELVFLELAGGRYRPVRPTASGRRPIPELEVEVGLHDGWARLWFRGELVPLPGELWRQLEDVRAARLAAEAETARLREEIARLRGG